MAKRQRPRLTLDLEGSRIPADRFKRAVNAFIDLVEQVGREVSGRRVDWIVSVKGGSAHLSASPEPAPRVPAALIVKAISSGMRLMERRAQRPRHFSDEALVSARELANVADGKGIVSAQITSDKVAPVAVSKRTALHVETLLDAFIKDYGTIEGRLESMSRRGGPHFFVFDALTDEAVRCYIREEKMHDVLGAFGRRVAVSGLVRYRKTNGQPMSVEVETIFVFPPEEKLPTADDVYGILSSAG
jgi:hypothetical protein